MYATCLFCNRPLGANQVLESFPVGRRLAFDGRKGRLWVVCRRCERWNLSPFEERWEAVEQCERLFRDARKRVSSDNIGLAKLDEGLELVRIGDPLRPEFAAWRYGDQFGRRRRKAMVTGTAVAGVAAAVVIGGATTGLATGGGYWVYQLVQGLVDAYRKRRVVARVPTEEGARLVVRGSHLYRTSLQRDPDSETGWSLQVRHAEGTAVLKHHHATHATALLMPPVNRAGGSRRQVQDAVRRIEAAGDPLRYVQSAAGELRYSRSARQRVPVSLARMPLANRLAIEMAVNEENERIALEGELALLELAWKEAEEIAAIADSLAIPREVETQLEELRRKA